MFLTTPAFIGDRAVRFIDTGTYSSLYDQYSLAAKAKQEALERSTGVRYLPPRMGSRHFVSVRRAACIPHEATNICSVAQDKWPWTEDGLTIYINIYAGKHFLLGKIVRNGNVMKTSFMDGFGREPDEFLTVRRCEWQRAKPHTWLCVLRFLYYFR